MHPAFCAAQNSDPAGAQVITAVDGQTQYLGVQQPSEMNVPTSCPSQRNSQSGSGYSVVVVLLLLAAVDMVVVEEAVVDVALVVEVEDIIVVEGFSSSQQ